MGALASIPFLGDTVASRSHARIRHPSTEGRVMAAMKVVGVGLWGSLQLPGRQALGWGFEGGQESIGWDADDDGAMTGSSVCVYYLDAH